MHEYELLLETGEISLEALDEIVAALMRAIDMLDAPAASDAPSA